MLNEGDPVRVWAGNCWRYGRYLRTIENGKRFGWRVVTLSEISPEGLKTRERRFPPDHCVRPGGGDAP